MKNGLCLFVLFLCVIPSFSQNTYVEGYVITNSRDTLRGFIFDKGLDRGTKRIQFKSQIADTNITEYKPLDILGFYITPYQEYFFGHALDIDVKPINSGQLESNPVARLKRDTVFLKLLTKGKASLYTYKDDQKQHFFQQKDGGTIGELLNIYYNNGKVPITIVESYKSQLTETFSDCATVNANNAEYNESSLISIFTKYNSCMGVRNEYVKSKKKEKPQLYLIGGVFNSHASFRGEDEYNNSETAAAATYESTIAPVFGVGFQFTPMRPSNPLSFGAEILYRKDVHDSYSRTSKAETTIHFEYSCIRINYLMKYSFINSKLRPYIKAGITTGFSFNETNYMNIIKSPDIVPFHVYEGEAADLSAFDMGFIAGFGIPFAKRFIGEIRYEFESKGGASGKLNVNGASAVIAYKLF